MRNWIDARVGDTTGKYRHDRWRLGVQRVGDGLNWSSEKMAVTLSTTPFDESLRRTSLVDFPCVSTTGTLTLTFGPHAAIARACSSMPSKSSAKTFKGYRPIGNDGQNLTGKCFVIGHS